VSQIEADLDFARAGADTSFSRNAVVAQEVPPCCFRDHISVPTIPRIGRGRGAIVDRRGPAVVSPWIITGGLRTPAAFIKAMPLEPMDCLANAAIQAKLACVWGPICIRTTVPRPASPTQNPDLAPQADIEHMPLIVWRAFSAASSIYCMVMARACGHTTLSGFCCSRSSPAGHRDLARPAPSLLGGGAEG